MSWDFAIYGKLRFEEEGEGERWLDCAIQPDQYGDTVWPFTNELKWQKKSVYTVRDFIERWNDLFEDDFNPLDFKIFRGKSEDTWLGYLEKDVVSDLGHEIAGAFRAASACKCTGELFFIGIGNPLAFKITVENGHSEIWELEENLEESEMVYKVLKWAAEILQERMDRRKK